MLLSSFTRFRIFIFPHVSPKLTMPLCVADSAFVSEAVHDLLQLNLVEEIFCAPDIINLLSVLLAVRVNKD